jgi:hypothetical protein
MDAAMMCRRQGDCEPFSFSGSSSNRVMSATGIQASAADHLQKITRSGLGVARFSLHLVSGNKLWKSQAFTGNVENSYTNHQQSP